MIPANKRSKRQDNQKNQMKSTSLNYDKNGKNYDIVYPIFFKKNWTKKSKDHLIKIKLNQISCCLEKKDLSLMRINYK